MTNLQEIAETGKNYCKGLSLKDIAARVRGYAKTNHPSFKFSITTHYASMCQELHIVMKGGPCECPHSLEHALQTCYRFGDDDRIPSNAAAAAAMKDVVRYAMSYNYDHSDLMTDYFDVNFYLFEEVAPSSEWRVTPAPVAQERRSRKLPTLDGRPQARRFSHRTVQVWVSAAFDGRGGLKWTAKVCGEPVCVAASEEEARKGARAVIDAAKEGGVTYAEAAAAREKAGRNPARRVSGWLTRMAAQLRSLAAIF